MRVDILSKNGYLQQSSTCLLIADAAIMTEQIKRVNDRFKGWLRCGWFAQLRSGC